MSRGSPDRGRGVTKRFGTAAAAGHRSASARASGRGRSPAWSAPTAPARRPCCGCSPACCCPATAGSPSAASTPRTQLAVIRQRGQLHAAAVRAVRRPVGAAEPEPLRRPAGRGRRASARRRSSGCWRSPTSQRSPAGWPASFGRHEAKARPGLRPDPHAPSAVARRAERRRRPDLAARAVADGLRAGRPGHRRGLEHRLPRRGRALREVLLLNEGKVLYDGPPKELTARVAGRSFLVQGRGGPDDSSWPGRCGARRSSTG